MSMRDLQEGLSRWVRLERREGDPMVTQSQVGNVAVTEVNAFPEVPPNAVRADVHFVLVAPTEGFPETDVLIKTVQGALGDGEFQDMSAEDLAGGPSYLALGGWLGSQDLALMFIGAVDLAGIAKAITPKALGLDGEAADQAAGMGLVMLGPTKAWAGEGE